MKISNNILLGSMVFILGLVIGLLMGISVSPTPTQAQSAVAPQEQSGPKVIIPDQWRTDRPVVVEFYATWCGACQHLDPYVDQIQAELGDKVRFIRLDVDKPENHFMYDAFNVTGTPTLIVFNKEGVQTFRTRSRINIREFRDAAWSALGKPTPDTELKQMPPKVYN